MVEVYCVEIYYYLITTNQYFQEKVYCYLAPNQICSIFISFSCDSNHLAKEPIAYGSQYIHCHCSQKDFVRLYSCSMITSLLSIIYLLNPFSLAIINLSFYSVFFETRTSKDCSP